MKLFNIYRASFLLMTVLLLVVGCADGEKLAVKTAATTHLDVYKSRTCQCCQHWVDHVESAGFDTKTHHPEDLSRIKTQYGITPEFQSCHTAVSKGGYVFEGHIPARFVQQFLADPPDGATGLSVPGMPVGSPGMEIGDRLEPYKIWLLKKDGLAEVFAVVSRPDQQ